VFVAIYGLLIFPMIETRQPALIVLAYVIGLAGSQAFGLCGSSTWFAGLFGAPVRYTGASLPYQIAGIITSGPTPLISAWIYATYHQTRPVAAYIAVTALLSFVCAYLLAETFRRDLSSDPSAGPRAPLSALLDHLPASPPGRLPEFG
jgi:MFS transporter, MHS family, shikimate and dehydroshikimate transport protein